MPTVPGHFTGFTLDKLFAISLTLLLSLAGGCAKGQQPSRQAAAQAAPVAVAAAPAPSPPALPNIPLNPVATAAAQQGVISCAGRIEQVTQYLGYTPQAGVLLMTPQVQPGQQMLPLVIELPTGNASAYVSASFAPNQANGCGATYDAVAWWPLSCEVLARQQFPTLKNLGKLRKDISVLDGGPTSKVFLMPAGNGCVSVKKEVVL